MREIDLEEFKERANAVLLYIKSVCDSHGIKFYLAYGTALGAVRHQGFIPWDDDIDIVMFRKDYERFQTVMHNSQDNRFRLLDIDYTQGYALPLAKVIDANTIVSQSSQKEKIKLGVWVDVFILDYVPDEATQRANLYKRLERLQTFWTQSIYRREVILGWGHNSLKSKLLYFLYIPVRSLGAKFWAKEIERIARKSNEVTSSTVALLSFSANNKRIRQTYPVSIWGDGVETKFEGETYLIPQQYDDYLRFQYGNYMELPPIEQRVSHHSFTAYSAED